MNIIEAISPSWALKREAKRAQLQQIKNYSQGAASTNQNWAKGRYSVANSPNDDITENLSVLHGRSRNEFMVNPLARGPVAKIRTNVIGSGLVVNPKPDAKLLNLSDEQAAEWERTVKREFSIFSRECDAGRRLTFGQIQGLALLSSLVNGDVFATLPEIQYAGQTYGLKIQLIEADRVRDPSINVSSDIKGGIRIGKHGESVSCFIHDGYESDMQVDKYKEVPFFGNNGTPLVLQVFQDVERPNQIRGVSVFAPIMEILVQIDRYQKSELMANIISAFCTVFIKTEMSTPFFGNAISQEDKIDHSDQNVEMGNGNIIQLRPNEDVSVVSPTRTNSSFDSVMTSFVRQLGIGLEIPYEVLVSHFQSSYSAARGALQEAWKMYNMRREWFVQSFCQPIYEQFLTEAIAKGRIQASGFFDDPAIKAAWCGANWIGPAQTSLNPAQEANAYKTQLEIGTNTRENIIQQTNGMTFDQVTDTLRRELTERRTAGLDVEEV